MNAKTIRAVVDVAMFAAMCFITGTGLLVHYRLPPGFMGGHGLTALGLSRHEWGIYHLWIAYFLLFLVFVHLVLNYAFVRNCIAAKKTWIVIGMGLIGLAFLSALLLVPIERSGDVSYRPKVHDGSGNHREKKGAD